MSPVARWSYEYIDVFNERNLLVNELAIRTKKGVPVQIQDTIYPIMVKEIVDFDLSHDDCGISIEQKGSDIYSHNVIQLSGWRDATTEDLGKIAHLRKVKQDQEKSIKQDRLERARAVLREAGELDD